MSLECILALAVFLLTYGLIAMHKIPGTNIGRAGIALIGGFLMILLGLLPFTDIWKYINFELLILLFGMMLIVAGLESVGFFDIIVNRLVRGNPAPAKFLVSLMIISAVLSATMLNDAVVLLLTPVTIKCCRHMNLNPIPYLIGLFVSSNIGSVATAVGNPQNAYIATQAGISFVEFSVKMLPLAIITLFAAMAIMLIFFRKNLRNKSEEKSLNVISDRPTDSVRLKIMVLILIFTIIMFVLSDFVNVPLYTIALISGLIMLTVGLTKGIGNAVWMVKRVDWSIILFFIGLFVILGGAISSGLLATVTEFFPGFGEGETPTIAGLTAISAIMSNLFSNVPSVILIGEIIGPQEGLWFTLAASSTLAGNATLMGAAANIIVAEEAEKQGVILNFFKVMAVGLPISVITLLISVVYMNYIF